jgi:hypothetical protein
LCYSVGVLLDVVLPTHGYITASTHSFPLAHQELLLHPLLLLLLLLKAPFTNSVAAAYLWSGSAICSPLMLCTQDNLLLLLPLLLLLAY